MKFLPLQSSGKDHAVNPDNILYIRPVSTSVTEIVFNVPLATGSMPYSLKFDNPMANILTWLSDIKTEIRTTQD